MTLNTQEAEDIVQDTLLKVWNYRERWSEIESMESFAMKICRNISLDHLRLSDNHNASLEDAQTDYLDSRPNPLEETQQHDNIERIRRIMDALPEKQRVSMQLRDFEAKSYKEISDIMEISEEQVKINIFRARKTVREKFLKQENAEG